MKRLILSIALCLATCLAVRGEEITPPKVNPPPIKITFEELADVPFDIAKNFPADAYYFWALAHNAKASGHPTPATPPVFQQTTKGFGPGVSSSGVNWGGYTWGRRLKVAGQYQQQTTTREFREQVGSGPVTLYNPYFRLDPK